MSDRILTEVRDGVGTLTINRPEKLNAFADDMREQIVAGLDRIAAHPDARVLVITGAGRAFSAGGDLRFMMDLKARDAGYDGLQPLLEAGREVVRRLEAFPYPTIASVNGVAAGGGMSLALACDLRIAAEQASFILSFVNIGLCVDWGGAYHLPRLVGLAKAQELAWTGDPVDAREALRIGMVNRVVPGPRLAHETLTLARRIAASPQTSVRVAKRLLRESLSSSVEEVLAAEIAAQEECWNSPDSAEGILAFGEKREAKFGAPPPARKSTRFE
jgi:2-(1,2-epoxy-1,2-dihydrophenyl)acetyl-CoA isomerase